MKRVMKILAVVGVVVALGGGVADAQEPIAATPPAVPAAAPPPMPAATTPDLKSQCMAALNADDKWTAELRVKLEAVISKEFFDKLDESSRKRHDADTQLIAVNKRHVVLAYAAIWLMSLSFIIGMWLRQQKLKAQLESLRRDLEAAIKS